MAETLYVEQTLTKHLCQKASSICTSAEAEEVDGITRVVTAHQEPTGKAERHCEARENMP